jgi:hypothetical protein
MHLPLRLSGLLFGPCNLRPIILRRLPFSLQARNSRACLRESKHVHSVMSTMSTHWHKTNYNSEVLLLRCLLVGGCLDFGEGPEEEDLQGPKLVNKRLSSGWDHFVGITYQKQMKMSSAPTPFGWGKRNEGYALRYAPASAEEHLPRRVVR